MLEHFWSRFGRHRLSAKSGSRALRDAAMRAFYLDERRSQSDRPADPSMWRRMLGKVRRRASADS